MTATRTRFSRRTVVLLSAMLVVLAGLALAANPIVKAVSGRSIGTHLAESDGHLVFNRYATAKDTPATVVPSWFPATATAVTVVQSGPRSGITGQVRVDAAVPAGTPRPGLCTPSASWSMPFSQSDQWPDFTTSDLHNCDGWTLGIRADHWYLWGTTD